MTGIKKADSFWACVYVVLFFNVKYLFDPIIFNSSNKNECSYLFEYIMYALNEVLMQSVKILDISQPYSNKLTIIEISAFHRT